MSSRPRTTLEQQLVAHEGRRVLVLRCQGCNTLWLHAGRNTARWCSHACARRVSRSRALQRDTAVIEAVGALDPAALAGDAVEGEGEA